MSGKRGPSVLVCSPLLAPLRYIYVSTIILILLAIKVTDSRERPAARAGLQRRDTGGGLPSRPSTRLISVDNVLQYASEIPSGQPRVPPGGARPAAGTAAAARSAPRRTATSGGGLPTLASARTGQQNMPSRTTKISEKLVLLPETAAEQAAEDDDIDPDEVATLEEMQQRKDDEDDRRPLKDEELDVLRKRGGIRGKSWAERLPKVQRREKVARLTAYCTAQAIKMKSTAEFLRKKHEAKTKLYDDCLYCVYHLPLLQGVDGYRVRSRPILKTPGTGKTVLDLEIERSERRDEHMGYFDEAEYGYRGLGGSPNHSAPIERIRQNGTDEHGHDTGHSDHHDEPSLSPINRLVPDVKNFAEMFVFSYGVVVFWNFSEHQEKDILADLTFSENETGVSLVTRPLDESDFETEEFHFDYSPNVKRPRVFNDMITLLPRSDHMVKLTISHAIAQSTKLCFFEEKMSETMLGAQHVPKRLALTGELNMTRTEIVKILGRLFKSRVDINLCKWLYSHTDPYQPSRLSFPLLTDQASNILDVPNFFWDSEPTLHPLYVAIREYLEIDPRIKVLNERCRVFLDLAEILSDSVADAKMSAITWIIIVLIVVSILVTVTEVTLRFAILEREKNKGNNVGVGAHIEGGEQMGLELRSPQGQAVDFARYNVSLDDLRAWGRGLTEEQKAAICGSDIVGTTYAGI
ncbi:uncharacterized protein E0L32_003336 [Thyridium curvatum]|uniref:DUF155 domain-containing protein n=1 Tax=Thyridium curvatum TaxID=1093900 RepID=A0A507BKN6_9PEZI|nr:uncharacterized protein E0L32_003336 [Thyridium curvatum]TPX17218.1 hypothetical protein E0L32_003336 [Thyridium curvatum]